MAYDGIRPLALWGLVSSNQFKNKDIDFFQAICPLYEPFIQQHKGTLFDIDKFRAYSAHELMLPLPDDIAQILSLRMASLGWLKAEGSTHDATVFRCNYSSPNPISAPNVDEKLKDIISTFRTFVSDNSVQIEADDDTIEDSFLRFFTKNLNSRAENEGDPGGDQIEYWIARFVSWTAANSLKLFESMEELSGTCLLAEAIMEMRTPTIKKENKTDLTVFSRWSFCYGNTRTIRQKEQR